MEKLKQFFNSKWLRIIILIVAVINNALVLFIPELGGIYEVASYFVTTAAAVWCAWKNNDFTTAAKLATNIMYAIKDGIISEDDALDFLEEKINSADDDDDDEAVAQG